MEKAKLEKVQVVIMHYYKCEEVTDTKFLL